ncbi:MAG TPA: helix-turn-helix domain-containing protein [Hydrogenophaga sp.]|nr:helix-turn-helix domain-containing protein [Hydrogenophaga sp.]HSX94530.1 helix-turn-helix domain-containing protein [Hydrogenophaga sp.]
MARKLPSVDPDVSPLAQSLPELGLIVRNARAQGGFRIDDAAQLAGVSSDLVSRLENGKPVTTDKLLKLLDTMGLALLVMPHAQASRALRAVPADAPHPTETPHDHRDE